MILKPEHQATVHSLTGVPAGALLVLTTTVDAIPSDCNVSSSPVLTWTKRVDAGAANSDNAEIWTAVYSAGGAITVTSNWGGDNSQASVCYVVLNAEAYVRRGFWNSHFTIRSIRYHYDHERKQYYFWLYSRLESNKWSYPDIKRRGYRKTIISKMAMSLLIIILKRPRS